MSINPRPAAYSPMRIIIAFSISGNFSPVILAIREIFTGSPLTSGVHAPARNEDMSRTDAETVVNQHNFCTLDFSGEWGERRLTMKSFDAAGRELWKREVGANELTHARP